jgi:hypothetical protein
MTPETNRAKRTLATLRSFLVPNCREMSRRSSRALDAPLPFLERLGFGLHLLLCRFCRRYWGQLQRLRRTAPRTPVASPAAPRLSAEARSRIKRSLREGDRESS